MWPNITKLSLWLQFANWHQSRRARSVGPSRGRPRVESFRKASTFLSSSLAFQLASRLPQVVSWDDLWTRLSHDIVEDLISGPAISCFTRNSLSCRYVSFSHVLVYIFFCATDSYTRSLRRIYIYTYITAM